MEFIVDANILFSAIVKNSATRKLFYNPNIKLIAPEFALEEIKEHKKEIMQKAGIDSGDFEQLLSAVFGIVEVIEEAKFRKHLKEAKTISPDINDAHYFALALFAKLPIWSNDAMLKKQKAITVLNTKEIIEQTKGL